MNGKEEGDADGDDGGDDGYSGNEWGGLLTHCRNNDQHSAFLFPQRNAHPSTHPPASFKSMRFEFIHFIIFLFAFRFSTFSNLLFGLEKMGNRWDSNIFCRLFAGSGSTSPENYCAKLDPQRAKLYRELAAMRRLAFAGICISAIATLLAAFLVPLLHTQVQYMLSMAQEELDFCRMRTTNFWREISKVEVHKMVKKGIWFKFIESILS